MDFWLRPHPRPMIQDSGPRIQGPGSHTGPQSRIQGPGLPRAHYPGFRARVLGRTLLVWLGGPGSWAGPAYTINELDSDKDVNIMVVYTKKKVLSPKRVLPRRCQSKRFCQKNLLFPKKVLPRRCQSKRLI